MIWDFLCGTRILCDWIYHVEQVFWFMNRFFVLCQWAIWSVWFLILCSLYVLTNKGYITSAQGSVGLCAQLSVGLCAFVIHLHQPAALQNESLIRMDAITHWSPTLSNSMPVFVPLNFANNAWMFISQFPKIVRLNHQICLYSRAFCSIPTGRKWVQMLLSQPTGPARQRPNSCATHANNDDYVFVYVCIFNYVFVYVCSFN